MNISCLSPVRLSLILSVFWTDWQFTPYCASKSVFLSTHMGVDNHRNGNWPDKSPFLIIYMYIDCNHDNYGQVTGNQMQENKPILPVPWIH